MPYVAAALSLVVLWLITRVLAGTWNPWKLVEGADRRPSTSKFQWWLWTIVVIFAYVAIYASRVDLDHFEALSEIPQNVLIALGLSAGTMAVAKGVTASYVESGKVDKPEPEGASAGAGGILRDDANEPDLSKVQLIAWTLIAIVVFMIAVVHQVETASSTVLPELPDIDPSLMVLMGLGQAAYLGKKLVTTSTPRLTGITPAAGPPGTQVTLTGISLGSRDGNQITFSDEHLSGSPIPGDISWNDTEVRFEIPATHPGGQAWKPGGEVVQVRALVSGNTTDPLPLTIEVP